MITLTNENIANEHICCAFSDKKCAESYQLKKDWLTKEFDKGYVFKRLNARAKVFIEYVPAENAWCPIEAPGYLFIDCFWVSGQYKRKGYGKQLLQSAIDDARAQEKWGLVTVVGTKKFHFMSDAKWLLRNGFEEVENTSYGFSLLVLKLNAAAANPHFNSSVATGTCPNKEGITAYFSNRCPYAEYHVTESLVETAKKRHLHLEVVKFETVESAQQSPSPATIFSLFYEGRFVTTDISACMDSRFDKIVQKAQKNNERNSC